MDIQGKLLFCPDTESEMGEIVNQWKACSVSSVYLLRQQIERPHVESTLKNYSGAVWIVFQMFLDTEGQFPLAITDKGVQAIGSGNGSWLRMLCPRGVDERGMSLIEYRKGQIRDSMNRHNPAGISLDFIRHFVFWEEVYESSSSDSIPRSCFCETCRSEFAKMFNLTLPTDQTSAITAICENYTKEWETFSHQTITAIVESISQMIKAIDSSCRINLHVVPWTNTEFEGARIRKAGQNLQELAQSVDQLSPMCYSPMLRRSTQWIKTVTHALEEESQRPVIPAIQVCPMYGTEALSNEEFTSMVKTAGSGKAKTVVIWPWEQLTVDQLAILRTIQFI